MRGPTRQPFSEFLVKRQIDRGGCAPLSYNPVTVRTRHSQGGSFVLETAMLRERYRKLERSTDHSQCVRSHPAPSDGPVEACAPPSL
jgi:hypothetical protein